MESTSVKGGDAMLQLQNENEALKDRLSAASEVNSHLASRIEELTMENDSLRAHIRRLLRLLKSDHSFAKEQRPSVDHDIQGTIHEEDEDIQKRMEEVESHRAKSNAATRVSLGKEADSQGLTLDPKYVSLGDVLGKGTFGTTYKGFWQGIEVAVKAVSPSEDSREAFQREVQVLSIVRHAHVVQLYGVVFEPEIEKCWLVCELLSGLSLSDWIHGKSSRNNVPPRSFVERLRAIMHVACGMQALEQMQPYSCVHRDLKPSNVLWNGSDKWKVADMGLSRVLSPEAMVSLTPETGSYLYMAPEVIRHDTYATQADVWSWACLATETLISTRPYAELHLTPIQIALKVADGNLKPSIPSNCPEKLAGLLIACFDLNPLERPSFAVIAAMMRKIVEDEEQSRQAGASRSWQWFSRT